MVAGTSLLGVGCVRGHAPPPESVRVEPESGGPSYVATFRLQDAGEDTAGVPRTRVDFVMHSPGASSRLLALGTEAGGCVERSPRQGELVRVSCWWGPEECHWVARRERSLVLLLRAEGPSEELPPSGDDALDAWQLRERVELPRGSVVTRLVP